MKTSGEVLAILARAAGEISGADSVQELESLLQPMVSDIGFDTFNFAARKKSSREFMTDPTLTSWSTHDLVNYDRDKWFARDPLLEYSASGKAPLLWKTEDWKANGHHAYHEYLAANGIQGGMTISLGSRAGTVGGLTLLTLRDEPPPADILYAGVVIGELLAARSVGICAVARENDDALRLKQLSGRQTEILKWIAAGKSSAEIAIILDLKKRNVDYHVAEILRKLAVVNRTQAAAIYISR